MPARRSVPAMVHAGQRRAGCMMTTRDRLHSRDSFWASDEAGYDDVVAHPGYRSGVLRAFTGKATLQLRESLPMRIRVRLAEGSVFPDISASSRRRPWSPCYAGQTGHRFRTPLSGAKWVS